MDGGVQVGQAGYGAPRHQQVGDPPDDAGEHATEGSLVQQILLRARSSDEIYAGDVAKLQDYRERGFSCQTIHKWVPFEQPDNAEGQRSRHEQ